MIRYSNGTWTITEIEYGIDDYAVVENVGLCKIYYNPEYPLNSKILINDVYYEVDEFIRV